MQSLGSLASTGCFPSVSWSGFVIPVCLLKEMGMRRQDCDKRFRGIPQFEVPLRIKVAPTLPLIWSECAQNETLFGLGQFGFNLGSLECCVSFRTSILLLLCPLSTYSLLY